MLEDPAPLEDLHHAALDDLEGRQAVDPLAGQLDGALRDLPRSVRSRPETALSVVVLPAPLAPRSVVMPPSRTSIDTP